MGIERTSFKCSCYYCGSHRLWETLAEASSSPLSAVGRVCAGLTPVWPVERKTGPGKLILPAGVGELLPVHRKFLKRRGFDPDYLTSIWGIQGIGLLSSLKWRVFIPVIYLGGVVSWTTRAVSDKVIPYMSAPPDKEAIHHKDLLYGSDFVIHTVVVNEGPLDAWAVGCGGVATFGLKYTTAQVLQIAKYPVRIICFDNEPGAQKVAKKLCRELSIFPGQTYNVVFDSGKDASRATPNELKQFRKRFLT